MVGIYTRPTGEAWLDRVSETTSCIDGLLVYKHSEGSSQNPLVFARMHATLESVTSILKSEYRETSDCARMYGVCDLSFERIGKSRGC